MTQIVFASNEQNQNIANESSDHRRSAFFFHIHTVYSHTRALAIRTRIDNISHYPIQ